MPIEAKYGSRSNFFKTGKVAAGALGLLLAGCKPEDSIPPIPRVVPATQEPGTSTVTQPSVVTKESTAQPILQSTATGVPPTLESTVVAEKVCGLDAGKILLGEGLLPDYQTVPVLSKAGFNEVFNINIDENPNDPILREIISETVNHLAKIAVTNTGITRIIVPEYTDASSVTNLVMTQTGLTNENFPFSVVNYHKDLNMKGDDTLLLTPHIGKGGRSSVQIWKNPSLSNRTDGSYFVNGYLHTILKTGENTDILTGIPGQNVGGGKDNLHADIAIVDGCLPSTVKVDERGLVYGVFDSKGDFNNPDTLWIKPELIKDLFGPQIKINPDFSRAGQVELIEENKPAIMDYFYKAVIAMNPDYVAGAQREFNTDISTVNGLNAFINAQGGIFPPLSNGTNIRLIMKEDIGSMQPTGFFNKPISGSLVVEIVPYSQYQKDIVNYKDPDTFVKPAYLFNPLTNTDPNSQEAWDCLGIGFVPHDIGEYIQISFQIVQKGPSKKYGFSEGQLSEGQLKQLDDYIRFTFYVLMSFGTRTILYPDYPGVNSIFDSQGIATGISDKSFSDFKRNIPEDAPPSFIKIPGK